MSRRPCKRAQKMAMLHVWYVESSLKQRPVFAPETNGIRKAPKAGWAKAHVGGELK